MANRATKTRISADPVSMPHADTHAEATAFHAELKKDDHAWASLHFVGLQPIDDETCLELRNCPCGSTIARLRLTEQKSFSQEVSKLLEQIA